MDSNWNSLVADRSQWPSLSINLRVTCLNAAARLRHPARSFITAAVSSSSAQTQGPFLDPFTVKWFHLFIVVLHFQAQ